ncbi:inositol diphosphatase DSP3-like [Curcuma longa]|uniref:inositol diphosphatase DSP3-like n=1 Tax=Curcuma longa TaxID=136217 RepID=UPI003D9F69C7
MRVCSLARVRIIGAFFVAPLESPGMMVLEAPVAAPEEEALPWPIVERRAEGAGSASVSEDEVLVPPFNFGVVEHGIYRSGFPAAANVQFLRTLNLKSIVCLCSEQFSEEVAEFIRSERIRVFQFGLGGTRETLSTVTSDIITRALGAILDIRNHPILIHCKRGKHRTGCLVGCFRKLQNWRMSSVHEEYMKFAAPKVRESDMKFMEAFDASCLMECVAGIIYRYHGFGSQSRRLAYDETQ